MSFGSFFATVVEAASKLTDTIVEATHDFDREQKTFVEQKPAYEREKSRVGAEAVAPWVGLHDEETLKTQIIGLSADKRNFLIDPPNGTEFAFDMAVYFPIAKAIMESDARLSEMRFQLVPKQIKEPVFWRNYFYRVSLIKQAAQLSHPVQPEINDPVNATTSSASTSESVTSSAASSDMSQTVEANAVQPSIKPTHSNASLTHDDNDFISDSLVHSAKPQDDQWIDQLKDEMPELDYNKSATKTDDYDWEKELERELGEYQTEAPKQPQEGDVDGDA